MPHMNRLLADLVSLLDLETLEQNLFRGQSRDLGGKSVFGGQVIGQALVAASRTVEGRVPHSLHAYFLRPGDMTRPIVYDVDRVRDGSSFSARRVQAIQLGQPILSMMTSFQKPETGLEHQTQMPDVPGPDDLEPAIRHLERWMDEMPDLPDHARRHALRELAIEFRPVNPRNPFNPQPRPPVQHVWIRAAGKLPNDPLLHHCVLAYASDFELLSTALLPHAHSWYDDDMINASIDHAIWFHRDFRIDDWLLYAMDSPTAQGARGFSRGQFFDREGRLVASVVQESLMRPLRA